MRGIAGGTAITILAILALVALVVGGWEAGWWFNVQNHKRQAQIINIDGHNMRNGYANQQTLRDEITSLVQNVDSLNVQITATDKKLQQPLEAQRYAITNQLCADAAQITGDPLIGLQAVFVAQNCAAGAVIPGSQYAPQRP